MFTIIRLYRSSSGYGVQCCSHSCYPQVSWAG